MIWIVKNGDAKKKQSCQECMDDVMCKGPEVENKLIGSSLLLKCSKRKSGRR